MKNEIVPVNLRVEDLLRNAKGGRPAGQELIQIVGGPVEEGIVGELVLVREQELVEVPVV
jgi:hypothetical protein